MSVEDDLLTNAIDALFEFPMLDGPRIPRGLAVRIYDGYRAMYGEGRSLDDIAKAGGWSWAGVTVLFEELKHRHPQLYVRLRGSR